MRTVLSLLVVLLTATTTPANAPPPGFKYIPRDIYVQFAEVYPGYTFFVVVTKGNGERVPSTDGDVDLSRLVPGAYISHRMPFRLCAVPDDLLTSLGGGEPDWKWFQANTDNPRLRWATFEPAGEEPFMADPRARIVQKYRVTLTPTALEKEWISEHTTPDWGAAVGWLTFFTAVGALVWWLRRKRRLRLAPRATPPPSN